MSVFFLSASTLCILNAQSSLVYLDNEGKLVYSTDSKGNVVPDFSGVGYMNMDEPIPTVSVVKTVTAVGGDNLSNVQNAINEVAAMPVDVNGFRGAILIKAGEYRISDRINVSKSGIILRGEGADANGTRFIGTKTAQYSLIHFSGSSGRSNNESSAKKIVDFYVPIGAKLVTVQSGHNFKAREWVLLRRSPKQAWINLLNTAQYGWTPSGYVVNYERRITKIEGDKIYLDAPVMDVIDLQYADGYILRYTSGRIEKCGIENMRLSSTYTSETDEEHGWTAVEFNNAINGWAKDLDVYYFGYSAVWMRDPASFITVDNCRMFDPKSITTGSRKYSFNVDGQRCLVQNCYTRGGRHDYVNGSQTAGPTVFYHCTATQQHADIGPHHRWSTGILFDNIVGNGAINVQNRTNSGTGHGWAGAQIMFWNCQGNKMICQDPPSDHRNWAIGFIGIITNVGDWVTEPWGIIESNGTHVVPTSLFVTQLEERTVPTSTPDTPTGLDAVSESSSRIRLSWTDNSDNEDSFSIERSTEQDTAWIVVASTAINITKFSDTGLSDSTTYRYRIRAVNAYGNSDYSDTLEVTTLQIGGSANLALHRPVTFSSQQMEEGNENPATNAVDGDINTRWSSERDKVWPQWIEVDLGSIKTINKTEVVCFNDRAYQFTVDIRTDTNGTFTRVVDCTENTTPGLINSPIIDVFDPVDARYVRITVTGANVYGSIL